MGAILSASPRPTEAKMATLGSAQLPAEASVPSRASIGPVTKLAPRHSGLVREAAWIAVLTGLLYVISGLLTRHFRRNLLPSKTDFSWRALWTSFIKPFRLERPSAAEAFSYNGLQRLTYLFVMVVLFPLVIWSGLAMSLGFASAFPWSVNLLGGRQSARTIHFFVILALVLFLFVHVSMVCLAGFWSRTGAMITGRTRTRKEHA